MIPNHDEVTTEESVSGLIKASLRLMKYRFWGLLVLSILPVAISIFSLGGLGMLISSGITQGMSVLTLLELLAVLVLIVILTSWMQLSLYVFLVSKHKITVNESISRARKNIAKFWLLNLVMGVLITGNFLLLFIPGILFVFWLSMVYLVMADSDEGVVNTMLISKEITSRKWWWLVKSFAWFVLVYLVEFELDKFFKDNNGLVVIGLLYEVTKVWFGVFTYCYLAKVYEVLTKVGPVDTNFSRKTKLWFFLPGLLAMFLAIVVIPVTTLLAVNPAKQFKTAREAVRKQNLRTLNTATQNYYAENGKFPKNIEELTPTWVKTNIEDPEPGVMYRLKMTGLKTFQVCAIQDKVDIECW